MLDLRQNVRLSERNASWLIGLASLLLVVTVATLLLAPRGAFLQLIPLSRAEVSWLPRLNAGLNGASAFLLLAGYLFIRRRRTRRHRLCMLSALALSVLFLLSYATYHAIAGSTRFVMSGWIRPVYFALLVSHIILAAAVVPLALTTLFFAWQQLERGPSRHRRLARWTLPIWLYVSVSGVVIYWMLYHLS